MNLLPFTYFPCVGHIPQLVCLMMISVTALWQLPSGLARREIVKLGKKIIAKPAKSLCPRPWNNHKNSNLSPTYLMNQWLLTKGTIGWHFTSHPCGWSMLTQRKQPRQRRQFLLTMTTRERLKMSSNADHD